MRPEPLDSSASSRDVAIVLPADFGVGAVRDVRTQLLGALDGKAIVLDGSRVERVDTAGIQLLCALATAARRRGVALAWTVVSPALVTGVQLLGVNHVVQLDGVRQEGLEWFD